MRNVTIMLYRIFVTRVTRSVIKSRVRFQGEWKSIVEIDDYNTNDVKQ